tara:strand:+ start:777 stop:1406 length:630 start_codon:yes stop_codon:yes gene_type:complete
MWPESDKTEKLLIRVGDGDPEARNELLIRYRASVERLIKLRLDHKIRRRIAVSDVLQNVMLEANRRLSDFLSKGKMPFHLWIRQIAKDRIIDAHRRHRKSAKRSVDREQAIDGRPNDRRSTILLAGVLEDKELTPAARVTQKEIAKQVELAIADLSATDRDIILMRHYEQLGNQEVADVLEISEQAASMRYLRALKKLREHLINDSQSD